MTYNDIFVPNIIRCDRIISAFQNAMYEDKINEYIEIFQEQYTSHDLPPIKGYPHIVNEDDIENELLFLNMEDVNTDHIGQLVWFVTDGHHRSIAAIRTDLPHLEVELDYSCITNQKELEQFN